MENKVMDKKGEIINVIKIFKELLSLRSNKIKDLSSYEYYFEDIEEDIEDEDDLNYLKGILFNLVLQFKEFLAEYKTKYKPTIDLLKKSKIDLVKESRINKENMSEESTINKKESTMNKEQSAINKEKYVRRINN